MDNAKRNRNAHAMRRAIGKLGVRLRREPLRNRFGCKHHHLTDHAVRRHGVGYVQLREWGSGIAIRVVLHAAALPGANVILGVRLLRMVPFGGGWQLDNTIGIDGNGKCDVLLQQPRGKRRVELSRRELHASQRGVFCQLCNMEPVPVSMGRK